MTGDSQALRWQKARKSSGNGACVEVASRDTQILMRHSKDPDGPRLVFTPTEFDAFIDGVKHQEFDHFVEDEA